LDTDFQNLSKISFIADKSVTSIEQDYEGGIWFSTLEYGIFYKPKVSFNNLLSNFGAEPVFKISVVNNSIFLAALKNGIYKYSQGNFKLIFKKDYQAVNDLFTDKQNNIVIGASYERVYPENCYGEAIKFTEKPFNKIINIQSSSEIAQISINQYFFSQDKSYLYSDMLPKEGNHNYIKINKTIQIQPGKPFLKSNGDIYIGTINNLYKINKGGNIPEVINNDIFSSGITCIREFKNGYMAIGLRFGGIVVMNDDKIIATISEKDGLINNTIRYLLPLNNVLWVATASGISAISFKENNFSDYSISNFGKNKGLYDLLIYQLVSFKGDILAATNIGILNIGNPDSLIKAKSELLPLYVTVVSTDKDTLLTKNIALPSGYNKLKFYYSGLSFTSSSDIKYLYRFETDSTWNETSGNELVFEKLLPGKHTFQMQALIPSEKRSSAIFTIDINIATPWTQNKWILSLAILLMFFIIYLFFKWRVKKIRAKDLAKASIDLRMAELEQAALRSQMNPHFIFNCLTSIQQLIVFNKNEEANKYLVQFSKLIRNTLEISSAPLINIKEEIDYLSRYLNLEKLRQPDKFDFTFDVTENINIDKVKIPSMVLQPLVENSIRHGFYGLANEKGYINIGFSKHENLIICTIADNGIGIKEPFTYSERHGIRNVIKRISLLSKRKDEKDLFEIKSQFDAGGKISGTIVKLKIYGI
jgi:two-component sensor histidine kinase